MLVHIIAGCTAFSALAIKFALIRFRPSLAYDLAPNLGGIAAVAYFTGNL